MKNTEKTTATRNPETINPETVNDFAKLLTAYATATDTRKDKNDPVFVKALQDLATACAYSVLKKCICAGQAKEAVNVLLNDKIPADRFVPDYIGLPSDSRTQTLRRVRADMTRALIDTARAKYCADNATETEYNKNGDPVVKIVDRDLFEVLHKLTAENLGVGVDLVSVATVAILDETKKQKDRDPALGCDLERPYTVHTLDKRVYIQTATSCAWKDKETAPIKEIYRAVRRYIMETGAERGDPCAKYCYIEDFAKDENGNETADRIYYRLGKYSDLGGYVKDFNGQETFIVVDSATAKRARETVEMLNLSARQAQILKYRRQGKGYKAIATALGVTVTKKQYQRCLEKEIHSRKKK